MSGNNVTVVPIKLENFRKICRNFEINLITFWLRIFFKYFYTVGNKFNLNL